MRDVFEPHADALHLARLCQPVEAAVKAVGRLHHCSSNLHTAVSLTTVWLKNNMKRGLLGLPWAS